jgi:hypothetical protein
MRLRSTVSRMVALMTAQFDPFEGITDEAAPSPASARRALLDSAKRGYVPLRKTFVQRPSGSEPQDGRPSPRASVLYDLVHTRKHRALDLLLLLHALHPVLEGTPLPLATWANILGTNATGVTRAIETLAEAKLVVREDDSRSPVLTLLREDGSGAAWHRPGAEDEEGPGYFVIPHTYWTMLHADELSLPGKAMLLIMLAETQNPRTPSFSMAVERAQDWYGISERTAERGYGELNKAGVLLVKVQRVADPRHPVGRRDVYHRALGSPFDTMSRARLQRSAVKAARKAGTSTADLTAVPDAAAQEPAQP